MRKIIKRIVVILGVSLGVLILVEFVYVLVLVPFVKIKTIQLQSNVSVDKDNLFGFSGIADPILFFQVDEEIMAASLMLHPEIVSAKVIKQFPSTLNITLQGRTPIAYFDAGKEFALLLDTQGVVYTSVVRTTSRYLPIVSVSERESLDAGMVQDRLGLIAKLLEQFNSRYADSYASISELLLLPDYDMHIYSMEAFLPVRVSLPIDAQTLHTVITQTKQLYGTLDTDQFIEIDARGENAVLHRRKL